MDSFIMLFKNVYELNSPYSFMSSLFSLDMILYIFYDRLFSASGF